MFAFCLAGENTIVIVPGANQFLLPNDVIKSREKIQSASVLVCQFEILQKTVVQALKLFREKSNHGSKFFFFKYLF